MRVIALLIVCLVCRAWPAFAEDRYPNMRALREHEKEGVDFRVHASFRRSPVTVYAIHGGRIEPGSAELAEAIAAGGRHNLYVFEGIKPRGNRDLHVTSVHFDDPPALKMATLSKACASIHGFKETVKQLACVGGGNARLRENVASALSKNARELGIEVESPCERFGGTDPENIVNRCKEQGVQLELSTALRDRLMADSSFKDKLARVIEQILSDIK